MGSMTDKTLPATVGVPSLWQWFRSAYGRRAYPILLFMVVEVLYLAATLTAVLSGARLEAFPISALFANVVLSGFAVATTVRNYLRATSARRAARRLNRLEAPVSGSNTGSGDPLVGPLVVGTAHSDGHQSNHDGHGHGDGGGHGGGDSGGGDGGGGGGD